ncbi:MAG: porin [Pseudomonadota bacterium]
MKKSLIALAVVGAFAAPAFAATSNVDIGGTVNMSVDYLDADNAAAGGNWNVSSNASNIYFKGTEDLGGGLKALWQVQTYFSAGGTGNNDTFNGAAPDGVGSGNTYVGLSGGFGTVLLGKHEAPMKLIGRSVDLFGDQIGDNRNFTTVKVGANGAGFDVRPNNTIAYMTPSFNGLTGALAYATNAADTGAAEDASVDVWSASGKYENGPLMVGLGYEIHNLSEANAALKDEKAWRLAAGYVFGDAKVVAFYQDASDLNGVSGDDVKTWGLGAAYKMGAITLKAQYYDADDRGNTADTGGNMYALGVDYDLSKRTKVQFAYAATENDGAGTTYTAFAGGHGDNPNSATGGNNPNGFSVGVKHTF